MPRNAIPTFPDRDAILPDRVITSKSNVRFDFSQFDRLLDGAQSFNLTWAMGLECSCRANDETQQWDPTCPVCGGKGIRYVHPRPELHAEYAAADGSVSATGGLAIRGVFADVNQTPEWFNRAGPWSHGSARVTVKGEIRLGHWDRLVMVDGVLSFMQVLISSGQGSTVPVGRDSQFSLRYPIVEVLAAHSLDPATRYRERTDYEIDSDGQLVWQPGRGPAAGVYYSLKYTHRPTWIVVDFPTAVSGARKSPKATDSGAEEYGLLPLTANVRLDFLGRRPA